MTIVALAEAAVIAAVVVAFTGLLRAKERAHARREDLLLNQLLNLAGKPWQAPPAARAAAAEAAGVDGDEADPRFALPSWTVNPEQEP